MSDPFHPIDPVARDRVPPVPALPRVRRDDREPADDARKRRRDRGREVRDEGACQRGIPDPEGHIDVEA